MVKRVEFVLSMPSSPSWNGRWSGEGTHYAIVKRLSERDVLRLFGASVRSKPWPAPNDDLVQRDRAVPAAQAKSWSHSFGDGWVALVTARIIPAGERLRKSAGFCGYDWMVTNILAYGSTREPKSPTLNEVLARLGYTTSPAPGVTGQLGAKAILRDGAEVFCGTADDVWKWLRASGQYTEAA